MLPYHLRPRYANSLTLERLERRQLLASDIDLSKIPVCLAFPPTVELPPTFEANSSVSASSSVAAYPAINLAKFQTTLVDSIGNGTSANEATDGIVSHQSSWFSQENANPHWIEVRLPAPYPVGSAHVYLGQPNLYDSASLDLQYHDGSSWQTITSITGDSTTDHNVVFPETITATRFRIHTSADTQLRVKEFVLLPPNGPSGYPMGTGVNLNVVSLRAPTATSVAGTNYAINAVDGYVSNDSSWVSDNSAGPHRLTHRLPVVQKLGSLHLYTGEVGPGGTVSNPISDFSLQFEKPGGSFQAVPIASVSSGTHSGGTVTGNTSGELIINFRWPIDATQIRINTNQASATIREMVVMPAHTNGSDAGYPIGTSVKFESPPTTKYDDYGDAWYRIVSRQNDRAIVADETGASQTVDTTPEVERQYQLLYSYALDAYRIRSEDTGLALQVKDASLETGAAIVEGDYSAAPHQLWRLEPTDGGHFQVANVWSGMVLHTGGAFPNEVTQQPFDEATNPADRVEWRMAFNKDYFKKGIGLIGEAETFRPSWAYNWGRDSSGSGELPDDVVHAPMQWGRWNLGSIHQLYDDWNSDLKPSYLLGYNEPDSVNQANMSVELGIELWPELEAMDVPLVSPALTQNTHGRTWHTEFADQADALGFRQDYAGMHWYGAPNVNNILNYVDRIQGISNGRDVWITEFSPVDWSGGSGNWSEETNYRFILEFLYRADRKANLNKYALFAWAGEQPDTPWQKSNPRANSFIDVKGGELTPYGKAYASWDGESDPDFETLYVIHNRGASHRLQNTGTAAVEKASIRVEDDSVQWIIQDAGNDEVFITSAVDGRRAKLDAGNIVMSDPGATGWGVRWKIEHDQYGWHNIVHSGSGNYLRLNRINNASGAPISQTLDVVTPATAASSQSTDWWFVKPYERAVGTSVLVDVDQNANEITEDLPGGTSVGIDVHASGLLAGDVIRYSLADDANGRFAIDDVTGVVTTLVPLDAADGESHLIEVQGSNSDGSASLQSFVINVVNVPEAENIQINDGAAQRSAVKSLTIQFDGLVDAPETAFLVENLGAEAGATPSPVAGVNIVLADEGGKTSATLTVDGASGTVGGSLPDGNYRLHVISNQVTTRGTSTAMREDIVFGEQATDLFFRFFGDTDGDRDVDGQDYGRFGLSFLKSAGQPGYNPDLDFDGDGDIDGQDYGRFGSRFLGSLPG